MSLTDQTIRALRRLEEIVLETLRQHGISRSALGNEYLSDISGDTVVRKLVPDRPPGEAPPDVTLCLRALEVCGVDGMEVLSSLCPAEAPEVLLSVMPVPGFDRAEERKAKQRKGYRRRRELLRTVAKLETAIPRDDPSARKIWPVRRADPKLSPVYEELETLEERRHRDRGAVEEVCEDVLAIEHDSLSFPESLRRVGMLGIWSSVQRSAQRLYFARDALALSTSLARKLYDLALPRLVEPNRLSQGLRERRPHGPSQTLPRSRRPSQPRSRPHRMEVPAIPSSLGRRVLPLAQRASTTVPGDRRGARRFDRDLGPLVGEGA